MSRSRRRPPITKITRVTPLRAWRTWLLHCIRFRTRDPWMFTAAITTPEITANIRLTAHHSSTSWFFLPMFSPVRRNWIISEFLRAAMAKAISWRKPGGRPISWPECRMPMAVFIFWSTHATANTKSMFCLITAIRRSFFRKLLLRPPPRLQLWRNAPHRQLSKSNFPKRLLLIWKRQRKAGRFSIAPSRSTVKTARTRRSRITATTRCTTMNWRGPRAKCFSRPAKMRITTNGSRGSTPPTRARAAGVGGGCSRATAARFAVTPSPPKRAR